MKVAEFIEEMQKLPPDQDVKLKMLGDILKMGKHPQGCYLRTHKICTAKACNYPFCEDRDK